ncbi:MAG TPA: (2Fe-2S)-binding protein [Candidatus Glassbacteria bacterium]|nr:(2Fe-2S)-binding protein [Candidatus Glassbacteria bacterium]
MEKTIDFKLNGKPISVSVEEERMLLWVLRTDLGLTGTKFSCGEGFCGACTVIVDNQAVKSCQYPIRLAEGKKVVTIEGLAANGMLHPLQEAFIAHDAFQCGFCTSGMILNAHSLLLENPHPSAQDIIQGMEGNLCRCAAHVRIISAIQSVASKTE